MAFIPAPALRGGVAYGALALKVPVAPPRAARHLTIAARPKQAETGKTAVRGARPKTYAEGSDEILDPPVHLERISEVRRPVRPREEFARGI